MAHDLVITLAKLTPKVDWQSLMADLAVYPTFTSALTFIQAQLNISLFVLSYWRFIGTAVGQPIPSLEILAGRWLSPMKPLRQILIFLASAKIPCPQFQRKSASALKAMSRKQA